MGEKSTTNHSQWQIHNLPFTGIADLNSKEKAGPKSKDDFTCGSHAHGASMFELL